MLSFIWYWSCLAHSCFYFNMGFGSMTPLNAATDSMGHNSARRKRHHERQVGFICTRYSDSDYIQTTEFPRNGVNSGFIDLTSEDECGLDWSCKVDQSELYQGSEDEPEEPSVRDMLGQIQKVHHTLEADIRELREKNTELQTELLLAEKDYEESVSLYKKRHFNYMSAITNQALDITTGVCNISGELVPKDCKLYIMEKCGAVSTRRIDILIDMLRTLAACVRGRDLAEQFAMPNSSR